MARLAYGDYGTEEEMARAEAADLIYIPNGMAERCSNCKYLQPQTGAYCSHPKVRLEIRMPSSECCAFWDNRKIDRSKTQGVKMGYGAADNTDRPGRNDKMGYTTDEATSQGEEGIAVETMQSANPHDYLKEDISRDGIPVKMSGEKLMTLLRQYGLDPVDAGLNLEGIYVEFRSQEEAEKCLGLLRESGYGEPQMYQKDGGYIVQSHAQETAETFDPKGASLKGSAVLVDGEPGMQPKGDIEHAEEDKMHGDANEQEPGQEAGILAGVVEHEGHSAALHQGPEGFVVRGRGGARYIQSEPITKKEHAEEYAKEMLKAHAKLNERQVVERNTNLSEVGDHKLGWESVPSGEKKKLWDSLTGGAKHKITACMGKVEGHVDNPGAYCKSLGDEVGYKPE